MSVDMFAIIPPTFVFDSTREENDRPLARPTRESVLKRLYEALMRRSLTKIDLSQRGLRSSDAKLVKMALLQNAKLSCLKLGYNQLGDEGVAILSKGVAAHKMLTSLDLGFNHIGDEGVQALASALLQGSSLSTLYLAGNLFSHDGALALADAIRSKSCCLQKLHLTGNRLGPDGVSAITSAIMEEDDHGGICELFLGGTSMGSGGCQSVARLLQHSSSLQVISLANCNMNDEDISVLAEAIKENRDRLPLQALQLSFNNITCQGLDALTNALWGSRTLRELLLDNNHIGERGGHQLANILPHIKTLQVLDVGFNSIQSSGMKTLMKVVAETQHLISLSVSGNPIDTSAAKAVAYALAYNRSLTSLFLDHCMIEREGQRHIVAGVVSNSGISLRKLTGFRIGPVIVTIGLPSALEHWTNEQVLNFMHLMWEQSNQNDNDGERELDPLSFLPDGVDSKITGPLDASTVVEVAKRAFSSLGDYGESVFMRPHNFQRSFDSPVTEDAIMVEAAANGHARQQPQYENSAYHEDEKEMSQERHMYRNGTTTEGLLRGAAKSFVATTSEPARISIPDPARKKRIVDWLCRNSQRLNELSRIPFDSGELWRLHQHYFTPVVKESGGSMPPSSDSHSRIVNSLPGVSRNPVAVSLWTESSLDVVIVPQSDPALTFSQPTGPMMKRKVSYRSLGDATLAVAAVYSQTTPELRMLAPLSGTAVVAKMIQDGPGMHSMPPRTKRTRRNKTRISFIPRIKKKLDSHLDVCHEKALILMRQLYFVEGALLNGDIFGESTTPRATHLCGVLASEAEMIVVDMM